jgi:hypothetical protein
MALISDIDEYGFRRSEEEIKFLSESDDYFEQITKQQLNFDTFNKGTLSLRNNILTRSYMLKKYIRKGC